MSLENESKNTSNKEEAKDKTENKNNGKKIGIIASISLATILLIVLIIFLTNDKEKNDDNTRDNAIEKTDTSTQRGEKETTKLSESTEKEITKLPEPTETFNSPDNNEKDVQPVVLDDDVEELRQKYYELIRIYNDEADRYNNILYVSGKYINVEDERIPYKRIEYFGDEKENDVVLEELSGLIKSTEEEIELLRNSVGNIEFKYYNNAIKEYNKEVDKYNSLKSKISKYDGYDSEMFTFAKIDYKRTLSRQEWTYENDFSTEISKISEDKETIIAGYPDIYYEVLKVFIEDYNSVVPLYNEFTQYVSIDFIGELPQKVVEKDIITKAEVEMMTEEDFFTKFDELLDEVSLIVSGYQVMLQIKQPSKEWIIERLISIPGVNGVEAVDYKNDPNDLLGRDGGYCDCIYFSLDEVDASKIPGKTVIEKGTDGGGAIEIYRKLEHAKNRCEYLSQFDGTLLYSGSYTLLGTMVIRTSYQLTNEQQVNIVNSIVESFTNLIIE